MPRLRNGANTALRAPITTRASPPLIRPHCCSRCDGVSAEWITAT